MTHGLDARTRANTTGRALAAVLSIASVAALSGCAPDAVRNVQATGFNAYLKQISVACQPLLIGNKEVAQMIQFNAVSDDYSYFLDQTSRLYYGQIGPDAYRVSLNGFFGPGSSNERSYQCIVANLPAQRDAPPQRVISY